MADQDSADPVLRNGHQRVDKLGKMFYDQTGKLHDKAQTMAPGKKGTEEDKSNGPAGGFDSTPVPRLPPGYTLKITFHRAENLPMADINTLSSDPYLIATLKTDVAKRHKQDPDLKLRIPTIQRNVNPKWETEWRVANVPASGFFLKCRLYDEDPADHDDRLGNVHVHVDAVSESWQGFKERKFDIKKRMGSKRAYLIRGCAALASRNVKMGGHVFISIENLGKSDPKYAGRIFTAGPLPWSRHFSPLIGRLVGTKDVSKGKDGKKAVEKYNFQAVQIQLQGPVPEPLYHRYVEFKPFVAGMFTSHSLRGRVLNRTLHHQHARIYNYDRSTLYGLFQKPTVDMTKQFLDFVHYDEGGRIFTYIVSLDAQWRFTETGKEFGIDMLSKHTMHSDVSIYIAFSGEFFLRRLKHPHKDKSSSPDPSEEALPPAPDPDEVKEERPESAGPSKDPTDYEMIIDNDSGTYRPNAEYLDHFKEFMSNSLPGLRVVTLDCNADADKMKKLKDQQRERKNTSGKKMTYQQNSSQSSISSSDEEALEQGATGHHENKYKKDLKDIKGLATGGMSHPQQGPEDAGGFVGEKAPAVEAEK